MREREKIVRMMTCTYCNRHKAWYDGFPNTMYAICWQCTWDRHMQDHHAPKRPWWRFWRKATDGSG